MAILFNFWGSFNKGGRKYKNTIPLKEARLPSPVTKVETNPFPKIGKILCGEKWLKLAKNKKRILPQSNWCNN